MHLDSIDKKLLNLVQVKFPLTKQPYAALGLQLGIDGNEVIYRIEQLKVKRIIRQISPVLDARSLGYQTTLVAMRVGQNQLDKAERLISEHPGVSHGYERDHHFNLWFTLAMPAEADIETELEQLTGPVEPKDILVLPAVKVFKIGAYFDMNGEDESTASAGTRPTGALPQKVELSRMDRLIINELQQDLPLVPMPFADITARLGIDVEHFLARCQQLLQRGIMRRFGAAINHRQAGFKANGMACWLAPPDLVDAAGRKLASLREVSHCYERKTSPLWQYNLFAMVHSNTREACQEIVTNVSPQMGLKDYVLLFSAREFKKTRVTYLV